MVRLLQCEGEALHYLAWPYAPEPLPPCPMCGEPMADKGQIEPITEKGGE